MKRSVIVFFCIITFIIGLFSGFVLRALIQKPVLGGPRSAVDTANNAASADFSDNETDQLIGAAMRAARAISNDDYATLSHFVDPEYGVTFTPYSTVDFSSNLNFSADAIANAATDETDYIWGLDSASAPIRMTIPEYFDRYVWNTDYWSVTELGIDQVMYTGNSLETVADAYPDCRFVDFYIPSADPAGRDWFSLKLVFRKTDARWYLTGVIHSEWTA